MDEALGSLCRNQSDTPRYPLYSFNKDRKRAYINFHSPSLFFTEYRLAHLSSGPLFSSTRLAIQVCGARGKKIEKSGSVHEVVQKIEPMEGDTVFATLEYPVVPLPEDEEGYTLSFNPTQVSSYNYLVYQEDGRIHGFFQEVWYGGYR
jgi:hypothetical protein